MKMNPHLLGSPNWFRILFYFIFSVGADLSIFREDEKGETAQPGMRAKGTKAVSEEYPMKGEMLSEMSTQSDV